MNTTLHARDTYSPHSPGLQRSRLGRLSHQTLHVILTLQHMTNHRAHNLSSHGSEYALAKKLLVLHTTRQLQHNISDTRRAEIIHSIPEVQLVLLNTINIPRTLPRILLQQLRNFRQFLCRKLHVSSIQIFQRALFISAARGARGQRTTKREQERRSILTKIREAG